MTLTAAVSDADGGTVFGEDVVFTTDRGNAISEVADHGDGTYTATLRSTVKAGTVKVTAAAGALKAADTFVQKPATPRRSRWSSTRRPSSPTAPRPRRRPRRSPT
jgi:hypothetical protein